MTMNGINENLEKIGSEIVKQREKQGMTNYRASQVCNMVSNSGLRNIESSGHGYMETYLKISKGLGMNFEIINGEVRIIK